MSALVAVVSLALLLINGGRQVGRIETVVNRLTGIETKLEKVIDHEVQIGILTQVVERLRSDHKSLAAKVDSVSLRAAEVRGRLESTHD